MNLCGFAGHLAHDLKSSDSILGIETSCDDTALAVHRLGNGLQWHKAISQDSQHSPYGGIVPEIASREHGIRLVRLVQESIKASGQKPPSAIACTAGPGLSGCLAAGVALAQSLAYAWRIPLAAVNHLEGHLLSPFLERQGGFDFPYLALLASGGHTALVAVRALGDYQVLGETLDDAAGEAFDKTGTLLGLPFPGGAGLEQLARQGQPEACPITPAVRNRDSLAMSFSGLKTAAKIRLQKGHKPRDIAAAFQQAAIETMASKVALALENTGLRQVTVVGGVARNEALMARIRQRAKKHGAAAFAVPARWCTDNAAMIALAGRHRLQSGYAVKIRPRWPLSSLH